LTLNELIGIFLLRDKLMNIRFAIVLGLVVFFCGGCLHSYVMVATNPAGARVFLDYEDKGRTPAKIEFDWYGKHDIQVMKEGYERVDEIVDIKCRPYLYIPLDLVATILPFRFEDKRHYSYDLEPITLEGKDSTEN